MEYKKTKAILIAKAWSIQLYSEYCNDTHEWSLRSYMKEIRNGIIEELGIRGVNRYPYTTDIEYDGANDLIIYDAIVNSGKTITLYDLIDWFNNQYNSMREEAKDLPKLQFPVYKWEKGKKEDASFVFDNLHDDFGNLLYFVDENEKMNEYIRRNLVIGKDLHGNDEQSIQMYGATFCDEQEINSIDKDVVNAYMELSMKYKDYLLAYNFLRRTNTEVDKRQFHRKGAFTTAIIGVDPYRDLSQFIVHYGHGGNEPGYYFTYDLGNNALGIPILNFFEHNVVGDDLSEQEDIRKSNPHVLAKTLRVNRDILPFKIK